MHLVTMDMAMVDMVMDMDTVMVVMEWAPDMTSDTMDTVLDMAMVLVMDMALDMGTVMV